ncbi:hypothetical protein FKM82_029427 [Ascaphus truei]
MLFFGDTLGTQILFQHLYLVGSLETFFLQNTLLFFSIHPFLLRVLQMCTQFLQLTLQHIFCLCAPLQGDTFFLQHSLCILQCCLHV